MFRLDRTKGRRPSFFKKPRRDKISRAAVSHCSPATAKASPNLTSIWGDAPLSAGITKRQKVKQSIGASLIGAIKAASGRVRKLMYLRDTRSAPSQGRRGSLCVISGRSSGSGIKHGSVFEIFPSDFVGDRWPLQLRLAQESHLLPFQLSLRPEKAP